MNRRVRSSARAKRKGKLTGRVMDEEQAAKAERARIAGVRAVAVFEAIKGALVLAVGAGLLSLVNSDVEEFAEHLVRRMHLNPARHYPHIFIEAAARVNDSNLKMLAFGAFAYSAVRFIESYGLWRVRAWAEWFAIISGGIYLPLEVYEFFHHPTRIRALVFVLNLAIVLYLIYFRLYARKHPEVKAYIKEKTKSPEM
jgi:uncharacterized membrane protein (DUF2068 family)